MRITLLSLLFIFSPIYASSVTMNLLQEVNTFHYWLAQHQNFFSTCITKRDGDYIILCDKTSLSIIELKKLFALSPSKLVNYIKQRKVKLEIICTKQDGPFSAWCIKNSHHHNFKKRYYLQGQFLGRENTILLRADALPGSLVHEYIHFLEFSNKNKVFGKRYKFERVQLEKRLIKRMDEIILVVKQKERELKKTGRLNKLLKEMLALSSALQKFSKFQDLIDERNIFDLYLRWGNLLGIPAADQELAQKNMQFICKRKDLHLTSKQCLMNDRLERQKHNKLLSSIEQIIQEIRPKPDLSLSNRFVKQVPIKATSLIENIELVNNYIFYKWKMKADKTEHSINKSDNILPDTTLKYHHAHCVGLVTLYLLAFEQMGVEAHVLRMPGHVLVEVCDKKQCKWIETLEYGKIVNKQYYITKGMITENEVRDTFYLHPSSIISSIYLSLGFIANKGGQLDIAELFYKRSIDADRKIADGYSNLAALYIKMGKNRLAKAYLAIALKINPHHVTSLINSAVWEWNHGDRKRAVKLINRAQQINPLRDQVSLMRFKFYRSLKNWKRAFVAGLIYNLQHKSDCHFFSQLNKIRRKLPTKVIKKYLADWKMLSAACPK